jgi:hypothetical protein
MRRMALTIAWLLALTATNVLAGDLPLDSA